MMNELNITEEHVYMLFNGGVFLTTHFLASKCNNNSGAACINFTIVVYYKIILLLRCFFLFSLFIIYFFFVCYYWCCCCSTTTTTYYYYFLLAINAAPKKKNYKPQTTPHTFSDRKPTSSKTIFVGLTEHGTVWQKKVGCCRKGRTST